MIPPLAIIQARLGSTRLPGKVLMEVGGRSLVKRAWDACCEAFGAEHTVFTVPAGDTELIEHIEAFGGRVELWTGDENDVLGRFWAVAHKYRWHPDSVVFRCTPDDVFKDPAQMVRVANGERLPVETGGEAWKLARLDAWNIRIGHTGDREHIGHLIPGEPPASPEGDGWTVDTMEDLEAARKRNREMAKAHIMARRRDRMRLVDIMTTGAVNP